MGDCQGRADATAAGDVGSMSQKRSAEMTPNAPDKFNRQSKDALPGKQAEALSALLAKPTRLSESSNRLRAAMSQARNFIEIGEHIAKELCHLDGPLGEFVRHFCHPMRPPPPSSEVSPYSPVDLLPIHPALLTAELEGVSDDNIWWMKLIVICLDYHYCTGQTGLLAVPMRTTLSECQIKVIEAIGHRVSRNLSLIGGLCPKDWLRPVNREQAGHDKQAIALLEEIDTEKIVAGWPEVSTARAPFITDFLEGEMAIRVADPASWWLPRDRLRKGRRRVTVKASDEEWYRLCQAAHQRNLMRVVNEEELLKDPNGHVVVIGAGAIKKFEGSSQELLTFVPVMTPVNECSMPLAEGCCWYPDWSCLTGTVIRPDENLYFMDAALTLAFSPLAIPDSWLPHFAFAKKVDASAFGGSKGTLVRPALAVVPSGWHSAFQVFEAVASTMIFKQLNLAKLPKLRLDKEPSQVGKWDVDPLSRLEKFKIIREVGENIQHVTEGAEADRIQQFCQHHGLRVGALKQMCLQLTSRLKTSQPASDSEFLVMSAEYLSEFGGLSLHLLSASQWEDYELRLWLAMALGICSAEKSLTSILRVSLKWIKQSDGKILTPAMAVFEEILALLALAGAVEFARGGDMSLVVSASKATETSGFAALARHFSNQSLVAETPIKCPELCVGCSKVLEEVMPALRCPCPKGCGILCCSLICVRRHGHKGDCSREDFHAPKFAERFSGPEFHVTTAMGLVGIATQVPLMDHEANQRIWDFFSVSGREMLEESSLEPELLAEHWAPAVRTWMGDVKTKNHWRTCRSSHQPWGLDLKKMSVDEVAKLRQDNKMVKETFVCMKDRANRRGFCSFLHPYDSYAWYTSEVRDLLRNGFYFSSFSYCCFGGPCEKWMGLLHNSASLHQALHRPSCSCHQEDSAWNWRINASEPPWPWCQSYAGALAFDMRGRLATPIGRLPRDFVTVLHSQMKGAAVGFQDEPLVQRLIATVQQFSQRVSPGDELDHLTWFAKYVQLTGTDARLCISPEQAVGSELLAPYPAFRWNWAEFSSWPWEERSTLAVKELVAIVAELTRRTQEVESLGKSYVHVVNDANVQSLVSRGCSTDDEENQMLRRLMSLKVASHARPMVCWTLPKWLFKSVPAT